MITAVGGNGGYSGGKQFVQAEQLREKLSHLRFEKALVVKLVSAIFFFLFPFFCFEFSLMITLRMLVLLFLDAYL